MAKKECQVCGSANLRVKYHINKYVYLKCKKCGLVFLDQNFSKKDISLIYNEGKYLSHNYKYDYTKEKNDLNLNYFSDIEQKIISSENKYKEIMNLIGYNNNEILVKKNFLDIGCAAGFFLAAVKKNGFNSYGIEISDEGANFAKKNLT